MTTTDLAKTALAPDDCYRALTARDARFDGVFFVGVTTTRIYCRPICTAKTPGRARCRFYSVAAAAERDGFRACLRCRPELAPGTGATPPVDAVSALAAAAVARLSTLRLDDVRVDDLAASFGVTARHLRRALRTELGLSTTELIQSTRLAVAKRLLHDTHLSVIDVALASGFRSVRRFNAAFAERFGRAPSSLRRASSLTSATSDGSTSARFAADAVSLRLDFRAPLHWDHLLAFLEGRAIPRVESVASGVYRRSVRIAGRTGWIEASLAPRGRGVSIRFPHALLPALSPLVARMRVVLDLDAHPARIAEVLGADPLLGKALRAHTGIRVPGAFDPYETTVRAVLGQQVTVRAATTVSGRVVDAFGEAIDTPFPAIDRLFPPPEVLAASDESTIARLGMPGARARTLLAVATAARDGVFNLADPAETLARLRALPGIGDWTADYVAMRALRNPDAFPAGDLILRRRLGVTKASDATARAAAWRPWRAYAAMLLWASPADDEAANDEETKP